MEKSNSSKTPNLDRFKSMLMEREMSKRMSKMGTPSRMEAPKMKLATKPSMSEVTLGESPEKTMGRQMDKEFRTSRNEAEMLPKRIAGTKYNSSEGTLPKSLSSKQFFKELAIRDWADRAEAKSKMASARDKMSASSRKS